MTGNSAFIYNMDYLKYQFGPGHPFKPVRCKLALDLLNRLQVFNDRVRLITPEPAKEEDLLLVHTKRYVDYVRKKCDLGAGFLDLGDTPATKGLFEGACSVVGGSILGANLVMKGLYRHAFNVGGGLHHAKVDSASGFCVFNDIVIATRHLQKACGVKRIAILDIDGHHGDGTQESLYSEPILKISSHRIGIFPGTGYVDEIGEGPGEGYSVNIPLPGNTQDEAFLYVYDEIVPPLLEWYRPEVLLCQFGIDGHVDDPLVGLALTTKTYETLARSLHGHSHRLCEGRLLLFGGGGYNVDTTAKCWVLLFLIISGSLQESTSNYRELLDEDAEVEVDNTMDQVKNITRAIKRTVFKIHGIR